MGKQDKKPVRFEIKMDAEFAEFVRSLARDDGKQVSQFIVDAIQQVHGKRVSRERRSPLATASYS